MTVLHLRISFLFQNLAHVSWDLTSLYTQHETVTMLRPTEKKMKEDLGRLRT